MLPIFDRRGRDPDVLSAQILVEERLHSIVRGGIIRDEGHDLHRPAAFGRIPFCLLNVTDFSSGASIKKS